MPDHAKQVGILCQRVIDLLGLSMTEGQSILLGESNVAHMVSRHPADTIQHTQQPHPDRPQISQPEPPRPHRRASEASHSIRHTARHFFKSKAQIRHIPAVSRPL